MAEEKEWLCETCHKNKPVGVACVPGIPYSAAYCKECLGRNAHPFGMLRANITCSINSGTWDKWADPEVIDQGYIDSLNTFYRGEYMPFRAALEKDPPTQVEMLALEYGDDDYRAELSEE